MATENSHALAKLVWWTHYIQDESKIFFFNQMHPSQILLCKCVTWSVHPGLETLCSLWKVCSTCCLMPPALSAAASIVAGSSVFTTAAGLRWQNSPSRGVCLGSRMQMQYIAIIICEETNIMWRKQPLCLADSGHRGFNHPIHTGQRKGWSYSVGYDCLWSLYSLQDEHVTLSMLERRWCEKFPTSAHI